MTYSIFDVSGSILGHFCYRITVAKTRELTFKTESCATKFFKNPNLLTYWILHIACISPALWLKIVFLKFYDCVVICGSALDPNGDLQPPPPPPRPPASSLTQSCFKNGSSFFFSEINPVYVIEVFVVCITMWFFCCCSEKV